MLGNRLRYLRKTLNLTQSELANTLGITRGTYAHYEIGKREPDYETLQKIADFFEVSTDYLLGRTDNPKGMDWGNKTEEEKKDLYKQFVIDKADEPVTWKGKELTPEQVKHLSKMLDVFVEGLEVAKKRTENKDS